MQRLQIYKASAGSGKTFTLAIEYIKLLIQQPDGFRNILAVTFTNKATAEMKERILSQLYGIAFSLVDSENYFLRVKEDLGLDEKTIRENSKKALYNILHDYSFFHVETIDSFFQTIIRNLAHELQLSNNINLDLDQQSAIDEAVDNLIEGLTLQSPIILWILDYIEEKIEDNSNWNITKKLKEFANNIYNDTYQEYADQLEISFNKHVFENYKNKLQKEIEDQKGIMESFAHSFFDSLEEHGVTLNDLAGKSRNPAASYFQKILNGNYRDELVTDKAKVCMEEASAWPGTNKKTKNYIEELAQTIWIPMMNDTETARQNANVLINTNKSLRNHFNDLQLLSTIHRQLKEENFKNNRLLLAETPSLLHKLIDDSDAPFIFEKIGTRLKHIMIDEFQDTSRMQWNNFKPLLNECISKGNLNLIVGDIKQSIYRWRSGDWKILGDIRNEFSSSTGLLVTTLDTNRRSLGNIIEFNNTFFSALTQMMAAKETETGLSPQLTNVYQDVVQIIKPSNEGHGSVQITLMNEKSEERADDYQTETIKEVAQTILMLQKKDVKLNDIAILVRAKAPIPKIAAYFAKNHPDIPIISAEAFLLNASEAVSTIIDALRYLNNQNDTLAVTQLIRVYQNQILGKNKSWNELCETKDKTSLLPKDFIENIKILKLLPLYELIENIIQIFQIQLLEKQEAYVFYFLDQVMEFLTKEPGDLLAFLTYWEEVLKGKKIPAGSINGVQVHSIHASKGLEFNHVIIPFCDWDLVRYGETLWAETHTQDPAELPVAPVDFGLILKESKFRNVFVEELQQQWIDNINLLYVAFTRPKANLFIFGKCPKRSKKDGKYPETSVSDLLFKILKEEEQNENQDFIFHYGELAFPTEGNTVSENPLLTVPLETPVKLQSQFTHIEFRQSNKSQQFIESEDRPDNQEYIEQGLILHNLFSSIQTEDDVEPLLQKYQFDGVIGSNLTQKRISKLVHTALENKIAKDWFSGTWDVINERSILQKTADGMKVLRPDRVMIKEGKVVVVDFKFGNPKPEYHQQVKNYMDLIQRMGYEQVEGYLWYVYKNQILTVD